MPSCHCQSAASEGKPVAPPVARPAARSASALILSVLVAFFPKCPMCWAAYSSALGLVGFSQIPYMGFLLPVLMVLLGVHLLLLLKQAGKVGYGPFLISVAGAITLFLVRRYASDTTWALNSGILLMVSGSAWNSFAMRKCGRAIEPIRQN